jgi:modulator of FtsH protease HflC
MNRRLLWAIAAALVVAGIVVTNVLFIVYQTDQALVLEFGQPRRVVREPGLYIKWPFIENVVYYDKRLLDVEPPPEEVIASDQKRLVVDTYTRYLITNPLLFYQTAATESGMAPRLTAMVSASLRQVIGTVPLSALLSRQRAAIMHQIRDEVKAEATPFGIEVVDTRIRRADLPPQNSEAIYKRMNSERQQQAALYRGQGAQAAAVVRAKAERDRTVILAEAQKQAQEIRGAGDATAVAIYAKAYGQDQRFFAFYRSLDAYRAALVGKNTTFILSPESPFFRFFESASGVPEGPAKAASSGANAAASPRAKAPAQASAATR